MRTLAFSLCMIFSVQAWSQLYISVGIPFGGAVSRENISGACYNAVYNNTDEGFEAGINGFGLWQFDAGWRFGSFLPELGFEGKKFNDLSFSQRPLYSGGHVNDQRTTSGFAIRGYVGLRLIRPTGKVQPYLRAGVLNNIKANINYVYQSDTTFGVWGTAAHGRYSENYSGGRSLGWKGGVGVIIHFNHWIASFAEASLCSQKWKPAFATVLESPDPNRIPYYSQCPATATISQSSWNLVVGISASISFRIFKVKRNTDL